MLLLVTEGASDQNDTIHLVQDRVAEKKNTGGKDRRRYQGCYKLMFGDLDADIARFHLLPSLSHM